MVLSGFVAHWLLRDELYNPLTTKLECHSWAPVPIYPVSSEVPRLNQVCQLRPIQKSTLRIQIATTYQCQKTHVCIRAKNPQWSFKINNETLKVLSASLHEQPSGNRWIWDKRKSWWNDTTFTRKLTRLPHLNNKWMKRTWTNSKHQYNYVQVNSSIMFKKQEFHKTSCAYCLFSFESNKTNDAIGSRSTLPQEPDGRQRDLRPCRAEQIQTAGIEVVRPRLKWMVDKNVPCGTWGSTEIHVANMLNKSVKACSLPT